MLDFPPVPFAIDFHAKLFYIVGFYTSKRQNKKNNKFSAKSCKKNQRTCQKLYMLLLSLIVYISKIVSSRSLTRLKHFVIYYEAEG